MRSLKLTAALAVAAILLPAGAASAAAIHARGALRHLGRPGAVRGCHISLEVAPRAITAGEGVLAHGLLRCPEDANQTVTIYGATVESPYTVLAHGTTDEMGEFKVPIEAVTETSRFYAFANGVQSTPREVKVAAEVKLEGPPEGTVPASVRTGVANKVTFKGTVGPKDAGAEVTLQRQDAVNGHEWFAIQRGAKVNAEGKFSITHVFVVPGPANIRVVVHSDRRNVPSASNPLYYEIEQQENPQLELESTADPLSLGQGVMLRGKAKTSSDAAVPDDTTMKLLARTREQHGYTQVAEAITSGGSYSFPEQKPQVNTFYEVQGGGKTSAVLFEGVKYVLTAQASASTVNVGESVTFEGTVTPGEGGHAIYLERANAGDTAFHVIEQPTEDTGSTYKFVHAFYSPGTYTLRIAIPGGPKNGTTVSQPFTITVNPAGSGTPPVAPEPIGNSKQPPEGQL